MIGIDTNVLLRLFTSDSPEQSAATDKLIGKYAASSIRLTSIVIAELAWTLVRQTPGLRGPAGDDGKIVAVVFCGALMHGNWHM